MDHSRTNLRQRTRRRFRVRKRLSGTADRPRLTVFRSHKHIYAQVVDDVTGRTLASASTADKTLREQVGFGGNRTAAEAIGKAVAERAQAAGVKQVCFDRGSFRYHGRVAALAEAARSAGLEFSRSKSGQPTPGKSRHRTRVYIPHVFRK
jgi:large subunit ribosomal protein L18